MIQVDFPAYALSMYMSYKVAKCDKQPFCQKVILFAYHIFMRMQYICFVYAKHQKVSVKALV